MFSFWPTFEADLASFWSGDVIETNVLVVLNLLGALVLGLLVGYERSYRGRAAGMRTYGLVCMASAALTVIGGFPGEWFGGQNVLGIGADPTRIIQGIVTGVGFLGAGVIMKEGFNISGLTTAASIWAASVIGVLVGVGFYLAAVVLALTAAICMVWIPKVAEHLPSRQTIAITVRFKEGFTPSEERLRESALSRGYEIVPGSMSISLADGKVKWNFVAVAFDKARLAPVSDLARDLTAVEGVDGFHVSPSRT